MMPARLLEELKYNSNTKILGQGILEMLNYPAHKLSKEIQANSTRKATYRVCKHSKQ